MEKQQPKASRFGPPRENCRSRTPCVRAHGWGGTVPTCMNVRLPAAADENFSYVEPVRRGDSGSVRFHGTTDEAHTNRGIHKATFPHDLHASALRKGFRGETITVINSGHLILWRQKPTVQDTLSEHVLSGVVLSWHGGRNAPMGAPASRGKSGGRPALPRNGSSPNARSESDHVPLGRRAGGGALRVSRACGPWRTS